ncbi:MAG: hypothetical protein QME60_03650 [Verrucomicrobiota bacterium]|nr:hypothetical protein [Verrucomicrobiota bacterium]
MTLDGKLFLLSLLASTTTVLLVALHVVWIALTYAMRQRGRRVTYLNHDWRKIRDAIASVDQPKERARYERWGAMLRWTYLVWGLTMLTLAMLALFIFT